VSSEGPAIEGTVDEGLVVEGLVVRAGRHELVHGVDFTAPPGAVTALLGPNGAGKSTILRAVAGVERPATGAVRFRGDDLRTLRRRERARRVAFVEQDAATELPLDVRDVVALGRTPHEPRFGGRDPHGAAEIDGALAAARAQGFADRRFTSLSGGERQRIMLARALAQQPRLLLLDEPTNHLDVSAQLELLDLLRERADRGMTILTALHDLALAADRTDAVVVVADGRVVANGPTQATLSAELIGDVYGVSAQWAENPVTGRPMLALGPRTGAGLVR
jgi:iron complex transport system ATP-binding protein